jgi:Flp pilus assembly protein TadG
MRRTNGERGSQIVELAVSLPLLMFLTLAIIDGGSLLHVHQVINNSAREGARLSSQPENKGATTAIRSAVVQYAAKNQVVIATSNITVDQTQVITLPDGTIMTSSIVTINYPYYLNHLSKLPFFNIPNVVQMGTFAQFRNLY